MQIIADLFTCHRCASSFKRRHTIGRKPLYCGPVCRQRSYEARRRAAYQEDLPAVPAQYRRSARPPAFDGGFTGLSKLNPSPALRVHHALRQSCLTQGRLRETLCGAFARPSGHLYHRRRRRIRPCRSCESIAARYPPSRYVDPPIEHWALLAFAEQLRVPLRRGDGASLRRAAATLLSATATVDTARTA